MYLQLTNAGNKVMSVLGVGSEVITGIKINLSGTILVM